LAWWWFLFLSLCGWWLITDGDGGCSISDDEAFWKRERVWQLGDWTDLWGKIGLDGGDVQLEDVGVAMEKLTDVGRGPAKVAVHKLLDVRA
jgi:hypothetical protein